MDPKTYNPFEPYEPDWPDPTPVPHWDPGFHRLVESTPHHDGWLQFSEVGGRWSERQKREANERRERIAREGFGFARGTNG